jgi:flagellar P-ring protein precursor FlgI
MESTMRQTDTRTIRCQDGRGRERSNGRVVVGLVVTILMLCLVVVPVRAEQPAYVQDFVQLAGHGESTLQGIGLVTGLNGTGDKAEDARATARALAHSLQNMGHYVAPDDEFDGGRNVALVLVLCQVPKVGAKANEKLDIRVSATGNGGATSLAGGTLYLTPLFGPYAGQDDVWAIAQGGIQIDDAHPLTGMVRGGAQMVRDLDMQVLERGGDSIRLVLYPHLSSFENAVQIAGAINNELGIEGETIAHVLDAKSILVRVAPAQRNDPAPFIASVMQVYVQLALIRNPARVTIRETDQTIAVSGNVRVKPTVISHEGLSITSITPPPVATAANPIIERDRMAPISTEPEDLTKLSDLLTALQTLDVPVEGQISIILALRDNGALIGEVVVIP